VKAQPNLKGGEMLSLVLASTCQLRGNFSVEEHPKLIVHQCTLADGCVPTTKSVVMDANWRWIHGAGATTNCYDSNKWDPTLCPDVETCTKNCAVEGIAETHYRDTYGVSADGQHLRLQLVMPGNVGSRLYLLDDSEEQYELFKLKNAEISFEVDVATLPCGVNGAVYFVQMDADGGRKRFSTNHAGAAYGTGYCDAQCPHDAKFINGEPNILDWGPVPGVPDSGIGRYGSCCVEMDLWEANSMATAYTAHSCAAKNATRCETALECGDGDARYEGLCDKDGCDFQTYRLGNTSFFGPGSSFTLDSSRPFTLVTQFLTADNTDSGDLVEIRRHYKQDGVLIPTPSIFFGAGQGPYDSLSSAFCAAEHDAFASNDTFASRGGMGSMGAALSDGMVLVLSLWDDPLSHMLWLDSTDPPGSTAPGAKRGPCATDSGDPAKIEPGSKAYAIYSNLRWGEIGSTDKIFPPAPPTPPSPPPPPECAKAWGQCGGKGWTGPTCCPTGQACQGDEYYKGCQPGLLMTEILAEAAAPPTPKETPKASTSSASTTAEEGAPPPAARAASSATSWWPRFATSTRRSKVALP